MTIAQSTTMQAYQLNAGGSRARMAILRMIAADSQNNRNEKTELTPGQWREARKWTLKGWRAAYAVGMWQGHQADKTPVWTTQGGPYFRDEEDAADVAAYGVSRGHYTDMHHDESAVGIVACLPHGRFLAGYRWTSNSERVWFGKVFTDIDQAARMADEHARVFAESAREDAERFENMGKAEQECEGLADDVKHAFQARNVSDWHRDQCRELIETLKGAREELNLATEAYEKG